jgi:hypothetical protein
MLECEVVDLHDNGGTLTLLVLNVRPTYFTEPSRCVPGLTTKSYIRRHTASLT